MKRSVLLFSFLISTGFSFQIAAQSYKAPEGGNSSDNFYPVHISDKLNKQPWLQELMRANAEGNVPRRAKSAIVDDEGDERDFFVADVENGGFDTKKFRLMKKGTLTQIWFEIAEIDNGHLNEEVADSIFKYLEEQSNQYSFNPERGIIDLSNDIFGDPPNYDGDGLVDFLITDIQDGWNPDKGGGYVAGFFYGVDQFPDTNPLSYRSNERDVLYIDSYPGIFSSGETDPLRPLSTLSHEYQHLIHYNYNDGAGSSEYTFINEAQSNFASLLSGYFPHSSYPTYLDDTNVPIFRWDRGNVLVDYGRAAAFTSYLWDQLGFEKAGYLTREPLSGVSGINNALFNSGSSLTFADLLVNWGIANLVNDTVQTANRTYGYNHPFLSNFTARVDFEAPKISNRVVGVQQGGIDYLGFQQVEDLTISVDHAGNNGRVRIITKAGDVINVQTLNRGVEFTTPEGEVFDEAYIMLANTSPSPPDSSNTTTRDFTVNVSGNQVYNLSSYNTYSNTQAFYWNIPYRNASGEARLGFSNKFTAAIDALLHSLELFIVSGEDATSNQPIEVKGDGLLRIAAYTDNSGVPGTVMASDSIDFDMLSSGWQTFDVTNWELTFEEGQEFHIVYETIVPTINPDNNAIPLRLDNGTGSQNVTQILTGPEEYSPMFSDENSEGQHGVWNNIILAETVIISNEELASAPQAFELNQNYPNPFNPTTKIQFTLPMASEVQLIIYNALGQQVATLLDNRMTAGTHSLNWNAQSMASGVYFYTIKAGDFLQTRKMILLK
ncbi:MAG: T9SS type A sorting domain-containing protein [Balneolaceae bacterium]